MFRQLEISSPGKLILCGEHSVVYGKKALACSIDLRTRLVSTSLSDSSDFQLNLLDLNKNISLTQQEFSSIKENGFNVEDNRDIHQKAIFLLVSLIKELKWSHLAGQRVQVKTDIPLAAGLGSSASFSTCLSAYFLLVSGCIQSNRLEDSDLVMINNYSFEIEKLFHGKPSGIDNSVASFGGAVVFENGKIVEQIRNTSLADLNVLIINSGREKQTQAQVQRVRQINQAHPRSTELIINSINEISDEFIKVIKSPTIDLDCLNELITMNQGLLHSLHVNNYELNSIISWAQKNGLSAKITGSGGGGCCYALLKPDSQFNFHDFVSYKVRLGCEGVRVDSFSLD